VDCELGADVEQLLLGFVELGSELCEGEFLGRGARGVFTAFGRWRVFLCVDALVAVIVNIFTVVLTEGFNVEVLNDGGEVGLI